MQAEEGAPAAPAAARSICSCAGAPHLALPARHPTLPAFLLPACRGASTNPSKLLKKLRKTRIAATKGLVKGQAKRSKPLAGANQFHKKSKKMK